MHKFNSLYRILGFLSILFAAIVVVTPHPCVFHRHNFRDIELKYSRYESMSFDYINNIAFNMISVY